ncbi:unnamed protein product [Urochloa humidicola]
MGLGCCLDEEENNWEIGEADWEGGHQGRDSQEEELELGTNALCRDYQLPRQLGDLVEMRVPLEKLKSRV